MNIQLLLLGIVFLANLFLALFVYSRNHRSWVNLSFSLFAGTLAMWTVSISMLFSQKTMLWSDATLLFGNVMGVGSFMMFAKHFPEGHKGNSRSLAYFILLPIIVFILLSPFRPFVSGIAIEGDQIKPIIGPLYPLMMLWSIFGVVYGAYTIYKKFRKSNGLPRTQLKYLFWGFVTFLVTVTITGVILPALGIASLGFFSPVASLVMIGIISYAIVKHHLLDIGILVARSVAYTILVSSLAVIYTVSLFGAGQLFLIEPISKSGMALSIVLSFALAISFHPLSRIIAKLTDRIFFKDFYDSNKLLYEANVIMAATLYLEDVVHLVLQKILFEMKIRDGSFVLTNDNKIYLVAGEGDIKKHPVYDELILQKLLDQKDTYDVNSVTNPQLKKMLKEFDTEVVVTLYQEGKHIGWIMLGPKLSGEMYSYRDFEVLEILAPEIAVAIQNAKAYEEIRRFNITLEDEVDDATLELQKANIKLQELDKLKDEFVSVASHELRTPMTAIKSYLWMAIEGKGGELTEKQKYYLERAYSSTDRLIKLVNEMLNISRIESGRISLQVEKVELFRVLEEVIAEVQPRADELKLEIKLKKSVKQGDETLKELWVVIDTDKIKEVLINLIGNSLKFTPKLGEIKVHVEIEKNMAVVFIADTGVGIDPQYLSALFQKFGLMKGSYQTNQEAAQGTGLGLYISKSIIELHGGEIKGDSKGTGKGATFSFSIPLYSSQKMKKLQEKFKETNDAGIIRNTV